jgi:integrase
MLTTYRPHIEIIQRADLQPSTKAQYIKAIDRLIEARVDPRNRDQLIRYASELPTSSKSFLGSALNILYKDLANTLKASANRDNLADVQATLLNIEAMSEILKVSRPKGEKSHIWLTPEQVTQLTALPDRTTVQGRRDWIVLSLLLCGLRREEVATITFDRVQKRPMTNGQLRTVLEVTGKGAKNRTVPIQPMIAKRLEEWRAEVGDGLIARAVNKSGTVNGSLSGKSVYSIVQKYGALIELPQLQPHDLRRTFAQAGWHGTHDLLLVMTQLGHEDPETTRDYLDLHVSLDTTISDFMTLS